MVLVYFSIFVVFFTGFLLGAVCGAAAMIPQPAKVTKVKTSDLYPPKDHSND